MPGGPSKRTLGCRPVTRPPEARNRDRLEQRKGSHDHPLDQCLPLLPACLGAGAAPGARRPGGRCAGCHRLRGRAGHLGQHDTKLAQPRPGASVGDRQRLLVPGRASPGTVLNQTKRCVPSGDPLPGAAAHTRDGAAGSALRDNFPVHGAPLTELVGRRAELSQLDGVLDAVTSHGGATVLIEGEAGIGKSRLVNEMCTRAARRGYLVAIGRGAAVDGRNLPYGQVVPILREFERQLGADTAAEVLGPGLDALGLPLTDGTVEAAPRPLAGPMAKTWLFEKLLRTFTAVSQRSPTLLVFEDVHWADPGTLGIIDFVTRNMGTSPLGVACTYRTDELTPNGLLHTLRAELTRLSHVHCFTLSGLPGDDVEALVTGIMGCRPERALMTALERRTGGNPFFVQELVASGAPSEWSPTLRAALEGRLASVSSEARRVLAAASVLSSSLDDEMLRALAGLSSDEELDTAVLECVDRNLFVRLRGGDIEYAFRHDLVREAVYEALTPRQRTKMHRLVAEMLRPRATRSAAPGYAEAELAGHWWAAGEWREALRSSIIAADAAFDVFAFEEALTHLEHALACDDRLSDTADSGIDRATLLEKATDAAYLSAAGERSIALAQALVDAVDPGAQPSRAAMSYVRLARNQWAFANPAASLRCLARAEALVPVEPPTAVRARTLAEKARCLMLTSRFGEADAVCHQALAVARAVGARSEESHALASLGACLASSGRRDDAIVILREALAIAEELRSPEDMTRGFANLSHTLFHAGRLEEVAELALRSSSPGEDIGSIRLQAAALNGADAMVALGRWDEAEATVAKVGKLIGNCGNHPYLVRAVIAIRRGRFEDARTELDILRRATENLEDVQFRGEYLLRSAEMALAEDKPLEAYDLADQALSLAASTDDTDFIPEVCAIGARALGDRLVDARAHGRRHDQVKLQLLGGELADRVDEVARRVADGGGSPSPRASAFGAQCVAEVTRLHDPDADAWARTAEHWKSLRQPLEAAYCEWREAEALLAMRARRAGAAKLLRHAWRTCSELGAAPSLRRVEDLAQRARITLDAETAAERHAAEVAANLGITQRELEVLGCLAAGKSDAQIAESLFISKKTASVHVSNLLRKLDAGSRYEAAEIGRQHRMTADAISST